MEKFVFSLSIGAHTADVKSIGRTSGDEGRVGFVTGSRDCHVSLYDYEDSSSNSYSKVADFKHTKFVNAVAFVSPSKTYPRGLIASAGLEKVIHVHDPGQSTPIYSLEGHSDNVCALAVSGTPDSPILISGSWDSTARVWALGQSVQILQGHERAVWAVLGLPNGDIITGSADGEIKIWKDNNCINTIKAHNLPVRGLAFIGFDRFVSCSNDKTLAIWSLQGERQQTLLGHQDFIYAVDTLPNGEIISSSEDRSVRVWKEGECIQVIFLPAVSVWTVRALANEDIAVGTSDGFVRIFTRSSERVAKESQLLEFHEKLAKFSIPENELEDLDVSNLPGEENLQTAGKIGEVRLVKRTEQIIEAHQWNGETWEKIGIVERSLPPSQITHEGQLYDFVFDVDVGDGTPTRKLPYNKSETPEVAAKRFLEKEKISEEFLDVIVKFIISNANISKF